jgi:hypothetical protein
VSHRFLGRQLRQFRLLELGQLEHRFRELSSTPVSSTRAARNSGLGQNNPTDTEILAFKTRLSGIPVFTNTRTMSTKPGRSGILDTGFDNSGYRNAGVDDVGSVVAGIMSSGLFTWGTGDSSAFASAKGLLHELVLKDLRAFCDFFARCMYWRVNASPRLCGRPPCASNAGTPAQFVHVFDTRRAACPDSRPL